MLDGIRSTLKKGSRNLHEIQAALREGDELVCYKIDRLARSTFDLLKISDLRE
ncbi:recombinase family protein [Alteribacillus sp. HJP-4]|uniref:recombinase family protein n=1 Tax=Alteribacillus sp. HJP-4 TaxID=2775394 RepID=UPI0035CD1E22